MRSTRTPRAARHRRISGLLCTHDDSPGAALPATAGRRGSDYRRHDDGPDPGQLAPGAPAPPAQAGHRAQSRRLRCRQGHSRPVPLRGEPHSTPHRAAGARHRAPGARRGCRGDGGADQAQSPLRHLGRQEIPEPRASPHRSHRRRQRRPPHRGAEVRSRPGREVHLLRRVVDPPGHPRRRSPVTAAPCACRSIAPPISRASSARPRRCARSSAASRSRTRLPA